MTDRERVIKSLTWDNPKSLVVESYLSPATWQKYREALEPVAANMANDFTFYAGPRADYDAMPPTYRKGDVYADPWGCVWECRVDGLQGIITHHPLAEGWEKFDGFRPPDPATTADLAPWDKAGFEANLRELVKRGKFTLFGGERLWERLHFLRGYENAMLDLADGEPHVRKLIDMIVEYNIENAKKYLAYSELDCVSFQDDWGEQYRLMVSPEMWREYFFEGYQKMFQFVKKAGKYVYFHTDGYLLPVIDDLRRAGADVINLQSGCQTLDELHAACYDNVCVSVDIDRQKVMPFGTRAEVKKHIRDIYQKLDGGRGGVWVKMDVYPDTPLENIQAMGEVFEELRADA